MKIQYYIAHRVVFIKRYVYIFDILMDNAQ